MQKKKKKKNGAAKLKSISVPGLWSLAQGVNVRGAQSTRAVPTTFFLLEKVNSSALRLGTWLSFSPKLGIVFTSISSAVASNLKIFQKTNLRNFILFSWHLTVSTLEDPSDSSKLSHINNWHKPCHSLDSLSDVRVSSARSKPHLLYLP